MRYCINNMIKYIVFLSFLTSCTIPMSVDIEDYKKKANEYCAKCGGLNAAFINEYGNYIACQDGTSLKQDFKSVPKVLILGECK